MVKIALKGFTPKWKLFIKGIVARDKMQKWNRLWDDFIQEELLDEDLHPNKKASNDNVSFAMRMKGKKKEDLSKIKCFNYEEYGHYSIKCLRKK